MERNAHVIVHIYLIMPTNEKKSKKKIAKEEERVPKHVNVRLSYRDYMKLVEVANVASGMKEDKELKKAFAKIIASVSEEITVDKFLGLVSGLPAKERTLERFYSQPPRTGPTKMYFTDPEKCTDEVRQLHEATKKWTKGKLRFDQSKQTCPTDVRVMFYAYIRGKGLVEDKNPDITIDKFLKKVAPNALSGVKHVKRKNGSLIWQICSEIRGKEASTPKKKTKKEVVESEEESEEEDSDEESEGESSEEEIVKKPKSKRK
jgi:hypothetical protein